MNRVYFDHAATTPVDKRVLEAMLPYFSDSFGNPSSVLIEEGGPPRQALDEARKKVATLIGAKGDEIVFTSSATESNNLAIKGLALAHKSKGNRILFSEIEHYSIMLQADFLRSLGFEVDFVKVDTNGLVDMADLKRKVTKGTILASIMHANMEIGTIQPIKEIGRFLKEQGVLFHSDGAGTCGQIPVNVQELGVDAMTISGQQFYGPKGAAGLYLRSGVPMRPVLHGGFQEMGYRAGTENVPAIVGFGEACRFAQEEMEEKVARVARLGQKLWAGIASITYLHFTGHPTERLPGHVSFWIEFVEGESLLLAQLEWSSRVHRQRMRIERAGSRRNRAQGVARTDGCGSASGDLPLIDHLQSWQGKHGRRGRLRAIGHTHDSRSFEGDVAPL